MIKPLGNRFVAEQTKGDELFKTDSGIILGEERLPQAVKLKVIATGPDVKSVKADDLVMVSQFAPTEAREKPTDKTMIVVEDDVLGVIV